MPCTQILGQARTPEVIQAHLKKLFAGIHRVRFSPDGAAISAMLSMDGEQVQRNGALRSI